MIPVKASGWFNTDLSEEERRMLVISGLTPVNDIFLPLFKEYAKIRLLYGGRGGGKSEAIADYLIDNCLTEPYFKCYYGRKVFEDVRGSCFDTLIYSIKKRNLQSQFNYSEANTSTMVITAKNGNKLIPFGADKADRLKSIKDPTIIWGEEFDQFIIDDFLEIYPTLRTTRGKNELVISFNTHKVFPTHWLLKLFFPDLYKGDEPAQFDVLADIKVQKIFANYYDNFFIDVASYERDLRLASAGSPNLYEAIANGAWGVVENKNPWLYNFDIKKHLKFDLTFLPSFPVYLTFDFNNDPFACIAFQMSPGKGSRDSFIHFIKEFSGMMKIEEMCRKIKQTYPSSIFFVTGDRSGNNQDLGRNQTLYQMIAAQLGIGMRQLELNNSNLEHADSRILCNTMFMHYPNLYIDGKNCPNLSTQCQRATTDEENNKASVLLKNRQDHKNDEFDAMRYAFQTYFHDFAKKAYFGVIKK